MKKVIVCFLSIVLSLTLVGCYAARMEEEKNPENTSMFVVLETGARWNVVYHKETKVMYAISRYGNGSGVFTVLVNPDGTPMLYDENSD